MTVAQIVETLNARLATGDDMLANEVRSACGSDLMSDVLAFVKDQSVLITGLTNAQAVRTAEMMDIICIVLVRGKSAEAGMIGLARDRGIVVMETDYSMFTACGLLYEKGLRGEGRKNAGGSKAPL